MMYKSISNNIHAVLKTLEINIKKKDFFKKIEEASIFLSKAERIVITGMGKSGLIAQKVSATLTSTGSSSIYLHPADALHGDMGHIGKKDIILAYSNSGETKEIIELLPHLSLLGGGIVSICGKENSTLTKESNISIIYQVDDEGCPLGLAPMSSTTMSIIIGDAISACLIEIKNFKKEDFGRFHPAGSLGKKILTKVRDVMHPASNILFNENILFKDVLQAMVSSNLGAILFCCHKKLTGIVTDGDIKRYLNETLNIQDLFNTQASKVMTKQALTIDEECLVEKAMNIMYAKKIYTLPVVNKKQEVIGLIRMHDILL